jgi:hypothetical protein
MRADDSTAERPLNQCSTGYQWKTDYGLAAIEALSDRWNALAHSATESPPSDAIWMQYFRRAFGSGDQALAIHTLSDGSRLLAELPLQSLPRGLSTWSSIENAHTPCCMYAYDSAVREAGEKRLDHLFHSAQPLPYEKLQADGDFCQGLSGAARATGRHLSIVPSTPEPSLRLPRPWEQSRLSLPANMPRDTAPKLRRLERLGSLTRPICRVRLYDESTHAHIVRLTGPVLRASTKRRPWLQAAMRRAKALLRARGTR